VFSCFLMVYHCPVQVEASPIHLFPDGVSLSSTGGGQSLCTGGGQSQPPVSSDVSLVCTDRGSPILLFPHAFFIVKQLFLNLRLVITLNKY
jgi:hypothetical protein